MCPPCCCRCRLAHADLRNIRKPDAFFFGILKRMKADATSGRDPYTGPPGHSKETDTELMEKTGDLEDLPRSVRNALQDLFDQVGGLCWLRRPCLVFKFLY